MNVHPGLQSISTGPPSHVGLNDAGKFERGYRAEGVLRKVGQLVRVTHVTGRVEQRHPPINDEIRIPDGTTRPIQRHSSPG